MTISGRDPPLSLLIYFYEYHERGRSWKEGIEHGQICFR